MPKLFQLKFFFKGNNPGILQVNLTKSKKMDLLTIGSTSMIFNKKKKSNWKNFESQEIHI